MKQIDEVAKNHPYFLNKEENERLIIYTFKKEERQHKIYIEKELVEGEDFPVTIYSVTRPDWFKEIDIKINQLYFKINRLRLLMKGKRRPLQNILYYNKLKEHSTVYGLISQNKKCRLSIFDLPVIKKLQEELEKERYTIEISNETDTHFDILIR